MENAELKSAVVELINVLLMTDSDEIPHEEAIKRLQEIRNRLVESIR